MIQDAKTEAGRVVVLLSCATKKQVVLLDRSAVQQECMRGCVQQCTLMHMPNTFAVL